ncbi:hypothetical protein [Limisalsivibrio acetivorans]|uniref:hypothetical protein n=1 Tax=Limisalsivibrio acetivorans TaxID=1304888 RepID=UPI0003B5B9FA|nr:hypothetical protein [Limisalsivibrio acetivorans]
MKKLLVLLLTFACFTAASAEDIELQAAMDQEDFENLTRHIGSMITFDPNAPADPLGTIGFDVNVETTLNIVDDDADHWVNATDGGDASQSILTYRLHVRKGLPGKFDIGAMYSKAVNSNFQTIGVSLQYAILEGTVATPALSVRGTYSQLMGNDDLSAYNGSVGAFISKGFLMLKPYGGVSAGLTHMSEDSDKVDLDSASEVTYKGIVGLQVVPFPFLRINAEAGFSDITQFSLKAGFRF